MLLLAFVRIEVFNYNPIKQWIDDGLNKGIGIENRVIVHGIRGVHTF